MATKQVPRANTNQFSNTKLELKAQYWVPDESEVWVPGLFLKESDDAFHFQHLDKKEEEIVVKKKDLSEFNSVLKSQCKGVSDIGELEQANEAAMLATIRARLNKK